MTSRLATATAPDAALALRLAEAVTAVDAPDVVLAVTHHGRRTTISGGHAPAPAVPRHALRYELGSVTKTFTVLLLAALARTGVLRLDDPLTAHLPDLPLRHPASRRITLRHLATHTAGLPRIPGDLIPSALLRPYTDAYATYDTERLLHTFARTRPHRRPGTRWHYSNFGVALLAPAMARAAGADCRTLLARHVLGPLGTVGTTLGPGDPATTAVGHRRDGHTPVPGIGMGPFLAAGAVRATPGDLLTYLEALLDAHPAGPPGPGATPLRLALRDVQIPQLRHGVRHRETHTLTWFHHPGPRGPLLFHAGATFGQQAFLGFHPASGTGVAALATRRGDRCRLVETAYGLLHALATGR